MKFITIAKFTLIHEAQIIQERLEAEGIPCIVTHGNFFAIRVLNERNTNMIAVKVPEENLQKALQILKETISHEFSDEDDGMIIKLPDHTHSEDVIHCPFCHSSDVQLLRLSNKPSFWTHISFGLIKFHSKKHYCCNICLNNWAVDT